MTMRRPGPGPSTPARKPLIGRGNRQAAYEQSRALYDGDFRKWTNSSMIDEIMEELRRPDASVNDTELRGRILMNFSAGFAFGFIPQGQRENAIRTMIAAFADKAPKPSDTVLGTLLVNLTIALRRNRIPTSLFDNTINAVLILLDDPRYDKTKRLEAINHLANALFTKTLKIPALPEAVRNRLTEHVLTRIRDPKISPETRLELIAGTTMALSLGEMPSRFEGDIVMAGLNVLQNPRVSADEIGARIACNLASYYGFKPKNMSVSQETLIRRRLQSLVESKKLSPEAVTHVSRNLNAGFLARNYTPQK